MREAGDVCYADVYKDGTGVVEFLRYEDMKYAVKKLDDSKFRSHEVICWFFLARKAIIDGMESKHGDEKMAKIVGLGHNKAFISP